MIALKYTTATTTVTHKLKHRAFTVTRLLPQPPFALTEIKPGHTVAQVVRDENGEYNEVISCGRAGCKEWLVTPMPTTLLDQLVGMGIAQPCQPQGLEVVPRHEEKTIVGVWEQIRLAQVGDLYSDTYMLGVGLEGKRVKITIEIME